jgi:hypothetical protein
MFAMSEENQIVVPPSFVTLFVDSGRMKPNASRQHILARYEFCEDLATMLMDHAKGQQCALGVAQVDVLERIHRGLISDGAGVELVEATWVIRRLAELLDWNSAECDAALSPRG